MTIDRTKLDARSGQVSRLLGNLPAIFQELPNDAAAALPPIGRLLMAFESILLGLPKSRAEEWADLRQQPGLEEIIGGAVESGTSDTLLDGVHRYFDPGPDYVPDPRKVADYDRAPSEFLGWLAGWVALVLREDWTDDHKRKFIAKAAELYRLRGTKAGVIQFVQTYTGGPPVEISEQGSQFQLGVHSRIGVDTILDSGTPFFFRVKLSSSDPLGFQKQKEMVTALIELQKPAHTSFSLEIETLQFQIGVNSRIGVNTLLGLPGG
ncbi:MAG TPA: phage tail protein [Acetobacteraceae bacterium]|nr:phage tail protein [Acetobacteraceae bacterium]